MLSPFFNLPRYAKWQSLILMVKKLWKCANSKPKIHFFRQNVTLKLRFYVKSILAILKIGKGASSHFSSHIFLKKFREINSLAKISWFHEIFQIWSLRNLGTGRWMFNSGVVNVNIFFKRSIFLIHQCTTNIIRIILKRYNTKVAERGRGF